MSINNNYGQNAPSAEPNQSSVPVSHSHPHSKRKQVDLDSTVAFKISRLMQEAFPHLSSQMESIHHDYYQLTQSNFTQEMTLFDQTSIDVTVMHSEIAKDEKQFQALTKIEKINLIRQHFLNFYGNVAQQLSNEDIHYEDPMQENAFIQTERIDSKQVAADFIKNYEDLSKKTFLINEQEIAPNDSPDLTKEKSSNSPDLKKKRISNEGLSHLKKLDETGLEEKIEKSLENPNPSVEFGHQNESAFHSSSTSSSSSSTSSTSSSSISPSAQTPPNSVVSSTGVTIFNRWTRLEPPKYVLIIEDNKINMRILQMFFRKMGYSEWNGEGEPGPKAFISALTVAEARQAIDANINMRPIIDFVCVDIHLDQGFEVTGEHLSKEIREIEKTQNRTDENKVIIVAVSANAIGKDTDSYSLNGINAAITKPFKPKQLESCLDATCLED